MTDVGANGVAVDFFPDKIEASFGYVYVYPSLVYVFVVRRHSRLECRRLSVGQTQQFEPEFRGATVDSRASDAGNRCEWAGI